MVKTRVKKTIITGVTSEQVEAALSEFSQADSRIQKITAEMELLSLIHISWALNHGGKQFEEVDNPYDKIKIL